MLPPFLISGPPHFKIASDTSVPVMSVEGIHDVYITEDIMNGRQFEEFVRAIRLPIMQLFNWVNYFSVVIMDNAAIHHVDNVVDFIENQAQARLIFLPLYSPDLNPVEEVFSQVKNIMKQKMTPFFKFFMSQEFCCQWHLVLCLKMTV